MASSDEEGEIVADCISNYHFLDLNGGPVSFSILPLLWGEDDIFGALNEELVLRGTSDDGLQHIYKNVLAWRFELSYALPEIHVLSKDKIWIKLLKPRKSYRDTIRTILITVHFLHFVKKNPDTFGETVWNYIRKILSSYEVLPSKDDLLEHMPTIKEAARRDKDLSSSKSFNAFLLETSQTTIHGYECNQAKRRPQFIIETDNDADSGADDDSDEDEDETFDHVCALCDDGGEILCCEGRCIRSFHPTVESGAGSCCESLAYRNHQAIQTFLCKNCRYQQHQCFACGLLGSSDKSTGAEAIRVALKKLDEGCSIEDAKAVCEPEILSQIFRWKKKLGSYLAPFLNGMRYTSFGRHFTKVDKLKEVVDRLRWYVQDGDTIVDFCCGSNDFSCLMKEELDRMGKTCQFINFDVVHPKNDFNFEKRDWMTVGLRDLPEGSKLIMGFNPPFSKAYEFISKALTFRPKLLIITVPKETKRLDERKKNPYDIIWEDDVILAGKSFYLPGSINVHNQQMEQWNIASPPLYLWSHPDWTAKHKAVAIERGHIRKDSQMSEAERNKVNTGVTNYLMQETRDCYGDFSDIMTSCGDINSLLDDIPEIPIDAEYNQNQRFGVPELEYGFGNSQEVLGCEAKDENETSQAEDMCTDMDLSPMNSPLH